MVARAEREGREKEGKGGREREREGGFRRVYFSILYPSPVPKNAGKMNEVMVTITRRVSQQIFFVTLKYC